MPADVRVEWSIDAAAQSAFVEISGDRNPLHVDPLIARRLAFGRVAAHGMHLVLDTLERICGKTGQAPRRVKATFRHPVGIDDALTTSIEFEGDRAQARVMVDVWTAAEITVELGQIVPRIVPRTIRRRMVPGTIRDAPEVHDIESLAGHSGAIEVVATDVTSRFPILSDRVGEHAVAEVLSLTRLVGMHVPGLHSLLSSIDVELRDSEQSSELRYRVTKIDWRFSQVVLDVTGAAVSGTLTAFVRPGPVEQSLGEVRPEPDEFADQRWLVVGGSRGLGALSVLLLDAGGADVRFTYHRGVEEAAALGARAPRAGGYQVDVEGPLDTGLAEVLERWQPTHLAYMASPPIFVGAAGVYSDALFERFHAIYVERFLAVVATLAGDTLAGVLWPSSEAVEHPGPGMAEYAKAKRDGEQACRQLAAEHLGMTVVAPRFPRLLTDQTTSFVPVEFGDAAAELLASLRDVSPARER